MRKKCYEFAIVKIIILCWWSEPYPLKKTPTSVYASYPLFTIIMLSWAFSTGSLTFLFLFLFTFTFLSLSLTHHYNESKKVKNKKLYLNPENERERERERENKKKTLLNIIMGEQIIRTRSRIFAYGGDGGLEVKATAPRLSPIRIFSYYSIVHFFFPPFSNICWPRELNNVLSLSPFHTYNAHWHTAGFKVYFQFLKKKSSLKWVSEREREKRQKSLFRVYVCEH